MDRVRGTRSALRRTRSAALITGVLGLTSLALAGCHMPTLLS
jgi:hypothetical protein